MQVKPPPRPQFEQILTEQTHSFVTRMVGGQRFQAPFHYHPELELTLITEGTGVRFVGESIERFGPGDCVLIGTMIPHAWFSDRDCRRSRSIVVQFDPTHCGGGMLRAHECAALRSITAELRTALVFHASVAAALTPLLKQLLKATGPRRLIGLLQTLELLASSRRRRPLAWSQAAAVVSPRADVRVSRVLRHLSENFRDEIRLDDVARLVSLSPSAFSRYFRQATGRTFIETVNEIRLSHAAQLLLTTDRRVVDIGFECGFQNLSNFNRQFQRRFRQSPRDFRGAASTLTVDGSTDPRFQPSE